jgi:hypothetical protein
MISLRTMTTAISLLAFIALMAGASYAQRDVRRVKSIEFRGLKYISRNEIAGRMSAKAEGSGLVVDVDSIRTALGEHPVVKSFQISEDEGRIVISVTEKSLSFIVAVRRERGPVLIELDENLKAVSAGTIHASDRPLIIIESGDIVNGELSQAMKAFIAGIISIEEKNIPVMKEISEIGFADGDMITVLLKGRRTKFYLKPNEEQFKRMNYFAGYLDSVRRYPAVMRILDNYGLML